MADPQKIEHWKKKFANNSDEQLLADKHQWIPSSEMHIAAVQILHARQKLAQEKTLKLSLQHHQESLSQEKQLHHKTQFVAWLAVAASIAGILFQAFYPSSSSTGSPPSAQIAPPPPTALTAPSSVHETQKSMPRLSPPLPAPAKP